jgi:molecular chaperone GrpE (heat shock protein)
MMERDMKKYTLSAALFVLFTLHSVPASSRVIQATDVPPKESTQKSVQKDNQAKNQKTTESAPIEKATPDDKKTAATGTSKGPDKPVDQGTKEERNANPSTQRNNVLPSPPPSKSSPDEIGQPNPAITRAGKLDEENKELKQQLQEAQNSPAQAESLGPLGWFASPLLFWTTAMLFILSIALHAVHLLKDVNTSRMVNQLWNVQQRSANANRSAAPGRNGAVESLTEQVREQGKGLNQFTAQVGQLQDRLTERERQFADAVQAVTLTVNWIGQAQLREAAANDGGQISEEDRVSAIALLERYEEPLRANAGRVEPLAQAMAALMEKIETQPQMPPELISRAQSLHHDIGQFDLWQTNVSSQLASLRRGSFSARSASLQADQQRLIEQVNAGGLSVSQMVQKSRELLDNHFPRNAQKSLTRLPSDQDESEFKQRIASAPESLMDWFDSFSQFQSQMIGGQASRVQLDPDIMSRLVQIQTVAREALNKFDIQPEEIQVGRTGYDRRLHEATLVRQSQQFPTNTVIEVLRCGFRRMSTGEVLRRPQVVVAGAVAG